MRFGSIASRAWPTARRYESSVGVRRIRHDYWYLRGDGTSFVHDRTHGRTRYTVGVLISPEPSRGDPTDPSNVHNGRRARPDKSKPSLQVKLRNEDAIQRNLQGFPVGGWILTHECGETSSPTCKDWTKVVILCNYAREISMSRGCRALSACV